jgi:hypothetical protein
MTKFYYRYAWGEEGQEIPEGAYHLWVESKASSAEELYNALKITNPCYDKTQFFQVASEEEIFSEREVTRENILNNICKNDFQRNVVNKCFSVDDLLYKSEDSSFLKSLASLNGDKEFIVSFYSPYVEEVDADYLTKAPADNIHEIFETSTLKKLQFTTKLYEEINIVKES